ncbi:hypothetical protein [Alkalicoccus daliensis]|uniref:DUF4031 domain-containing protein n=1 Tax=Alkalicoccus daliensis TaxID=745820 RepID=A0A1H0AD86_9BACI|nr:hypothetical protein [Alkalicoccus daliensis]SDN31578.1 hypothetical protein SAMN04488053_101444 [Alkalicoccus daliensis]
MAFGVTKKELKNWKAAANSGEVAFLTHFWYDPRFPEYKTVTKAACSDIETLVSWGEKYNLKRSWIHVDNHFPHYDLIGSTETEILTAEGKQHKLVEMHNRIKLKNK